jgi:hypothetical protein
LPGPLEQLAASGGEDYVGITPGKSLSGRKSYTA